MGDEGVVEKHFQLCYFCGHQISYAKEDIKQGIEMGMGFTEISYFVNCDACGGGSTLPTEIAEQRGCKCITVRNGKTVYKTEEKENE
jgi:hypothetical protein